MAFFQQAIDVAFDFSIIISIGTNHRYNILHVRTRTDGRARTQNTKYLSIHPMQCRYIILELHYNQYLHCTYLDHLNNAFSKSNLTSNNN
jgi:hypothetical protein